MKHLKLRWRMWKTYTSKWEKAQHGFLVILTSALTVWAFTNNWILGVITLAFWANVTYTFTMKDTWRNAYHRTEQLRALGWHVTDQLHKWAFINITKSGAAYHIEPDNPAEDPDEFSEEAYTDEIVIRRGIDGDGREFTAYRIPEELNEISVLGMLETTKQQYLADVMEGEE